MIRWGCLVLGVAAIVFGVVGYLMHPPVAEAPAVLSADDAVAMLAHHDRVFVSVTAGADTDRRIYSTVCNRPVFGSRSPNRVYELSQPEAPHSEELTRYLGTVVSIKGDLGPQEIAVQVVASGATGDEKVSGERILAPVAGFDGLWAASPLFSAGDPRRDSFHSQGVYTGALTRLDFIDDNIGSYRLAMDADEIAEVATDDLGLAIDSFTLVLLTDIDQPRPGHFRLPVAGTGDALFVGPFDEREDLPTWVASGPIRGLMWVWDADDRAATELEAVLGHSLPPRYGVIYHDETAADHNRKTTFGLRLFTGAGGVMLVISVIAFFVRRRRART